VFAEPLVACICCIFQCAAVTYLFKPLALFFFLQNVVNSFSFVLLKLYHASNVSNTSTLSRSLIYVSCNLAFSVLVVVLFYYFITCLLPNYYCDMVWLHIMQKNCICYLTVPDGKALRGKSTRKCIVYKIGLCDEAEMWHCCHCVADVGDGQ